MSTHRDYLTMWMDESNLCVCYENDKFGNNYVDIPIKEIKNLLEKNKNSGSFKFLEGLSNKLVGNK